MIILHFVLLVLPNYNNKNRKSMPDTTKINNSNPDMIDKAIRRVATASGNILEKNNLDKLSDLMQSLVEGNSKIKMGHLFCKLAEHAIDSIVHNGRENITVSHANEVISNADISIERTHVFIGHGHNSRIQTHLNGPTYEKFTKDVFNTQKDCMETSKRLELTSKSGVNQRGYTFLDKSTFISIGDIIRLTNFQKHSDLIKKQMENNLRKGVLPDLIEKTPEDLKTLVTRESEKKQTKFYSALLNTETTLRIINRMPAFRLNIMVHLVKFRNLDSKVTTVEELFKDLQYDPTAFTPKTTTKKNNVEMETKYKYLERIQLKDIKELKTPKTKFNFSRQMVTSLNLNITKLDAFKKHCILVNSWRRTIPTGSHWYITIHEYFKDGIYLNQLYEHVENKIHQDTPISHFLLIEHFGDLKAAVHRIEDKVTINSVYSPCDINYEMITRIGHVSSIDNQDEILCYRMLKKTDEFEDEELSMDFYPDREDRFNINYSDIIIGNQEEKKDAKFRLELNASILESQTMTRFDEIAKKIASIKPEAAESLTNDDLSFMKQDEKDSGPESKKKGSKGFRGAAEIFSDLLSDDDEKKYDRDGL